MSTTDFNQALIAAAESGSLNQVCNLMEQQQTVDVNAINENGQ
jgi:hypothetical protein